jgi:hypothetical protein
MKIDDIIKDLDIEKLMKPTNMSNENSPAACIIAICSSYATCDSNVGCDSNVTCYNLATCVTDGCFTNGGCFTKTCDDYGCYKGSTCAGLDCAMVSCIFSVGINPSPEPTLSPSPPTCFNVSCNAYRCYEVPCYNNGCLYSVCANIACMYSACAGESTCYNSYCSGYGTCTNISCIDDSGVNPPPTSSPTPWLI